MRPPILLLLLCAQLRLFAATEGQVMGRILLPDLSAGLPMQEVIFENPMDKISVTTNEHGFFYADHLPTGKYSIKILWCGRQYEVRNVRVYDTYTTIIDFHMPLQNNSEGITYLVPDKTEVSSVSRNDIVLANNKNNQPSQSLAEVLSTQPGVDVRNGRLYVKGSDQVKFFIDGTPLMGKPGLQRIW